MAATVAGILLTGNHAARPSSGLQAGTLYACSTHALIYQTTDDGTTWGTWIDAAAVHVADTSAAHAASAISFTPNGSIAATDVQAAIQEVRDEAGSAAGVAADAIWDAAGDLVVGSGANTAAKLTLGAAGGAVSRVNGAVAWNSGTAFPTAATGDRYWRTDLGMEFYYDGTRWLSTTLYHLTTGYANINATTGYSGPSGTLTAHTQAVPGLVGGSDIWLVTLTTQFFINGGTALDASNKWVGSYNKVKTDNTADTAATVTIASGSLSVWRIDTTAIGALMNNGTAHFVLTMLWTKTGTPGPIFENHDLAYRIVAT